jgi:transcription antitermination factor NusA-like protein
MKSGILCARCQSKIESGEVSDADINVSRILLKLEGKYPSLQDVTLHNTYDMGNVLAIVVGNGELSNVLGQGGRIVREISDTMRKKIRVLEKSGDTRKFLEDLFVPVTITTINKIWLPDGSIETRVILSGRSRRLPIKTKVLKELAKRVRGVSLRIAFENQLGRYP